MDLTRLSLRLRVFLFFAALAAGNLAALVAGLVFAYARLGAPGLREGFVIGGVVLGAAILALIAGVWHLFDENVAKPIERLAGGMRARTHACNSASSACDPGARWTTAAGSSPSVRCGMPTSAASVTAGWS